MFNIKDLLSKFKDLEDPSKKKEGIIGVISKYTGITGIEVKEIEVKGNVVYLKAHPAIRHKVFMHKKSLIEQINKVFPSEYIIDIR